MYFSVLGAIITIVFNIIMIPKIGFMASAWATLLTYGLMMTASYYVGKKYYPVPYQLKKVSFYLLFATLFSGISFLYFRGNYLFSTGILLLFFGWIYWSEKDELKQLLKK